MLVIILCYCVYKRRGGRDGVRQKAINSLRLEEATTSFQNQHVLGYVSMVFSDDREGEGDILQNLATGNEAEDGSPYLQRPRPHSN